MNKYHFKDKVAIITGSSQGIGKAIAIALVQKGAKVVLNARSVERLEKTKKEIASLGGDVIAIQGDVTSPEVCKKLIEGSLNKFGCIDILINNAGVGMRGTFSELDLEVFERVMNINYLGAVYLTKFALPHIEAAKGRIMFISSVVGLRGLQYLSAYCASKMALTAIVETMKIELVGTGVFVGISYVGITQNEPHKRLIGKDGAPISLAERSEKKAQTTEQVASIVLRSIQKRKFKTVLTFLGKLNAIFNKWLPGLVHYVLVKADKKFKKMSE